MENTETKETTQTADAEKKTETNNLEDSELKKVIAQRDEAKQTARTLKAEIDQIKSELQADREKKLKEDGNLKELLEQKEKELSEIKSKSDDLDKISKEKISLENEMREILTDGLSKESKEFCKTMSISQIKEFVKLVKKENKIPTDSTNTNKKETDQKTIEDRISSIYKN